MIPGCAYRATRRSAKPGPSDLMNSKFGFPLVLLIGLTACKSNEGTAEDAVQSMRMLRQSLESAPDKITAVTASLGNLTKEGGDMKAEYAAFNTNVTALVAHRDQIRDLTNKLESSKSKFSEEWEKRQANIKDDEIRKRAQQRRTEVLDKFKEL